MLCLRPFPPSLLLLSLCLPPLPTPSPSPPPPLLPPPSSFSGAGLVRSFPAPPFPSSPRGGRLPPFCLPPSRLARGRPAAPAAPVPRPRRPFFLAPPPPPRPLLAARGRCSVPARGVPPSAPPPAAARSAPQAPGPPSPPPLGLAALSRWRRRSPPSLFAPRRVRFPPSGLPFRLIPSPRRPGAPPRRRWPCAGRPAHCGLVSGPRSPPRRRTSIRRRRWGVCGVPPPPPPPPGVSLLPALASRSGPGLVSPGVPRPRGRRLLCRTGRSLGAVVGGGPAGPPG